jgi:hypothetical protein
MKRCILFVLLCLLFPNAVLSSPASQKKIDRYTIPKISAKKTNLLTQKQRLINQGQRVLAADSASLRKMGPGLKKVLAEKASASITRAGAKKDKVRVIVKPADNKSSIYNAAGKYG